MTKSEALLAGWALWGALVVALGALARRRG